MKLLIQKAILANILLFIGYSLSAGEIKIKIDKRYLNIPVSHINPEKPDVPLNKNDAFQKVQKRRVQEKR